MASYDWADLDRHDVLEVSMVSAQNLDQNLDVLDDVILANTKLTAAYYTDTRVSGTLGIIDANQYITYSKIRFVHRIPEWGYSQELATLPVTGASFKRSKSTYVKDFRLGSMMDLLDLNIAHSPWTVTAGTSGLSVMKQMLKYCGLECQDNSAKDFKMSSTVVYESGASFLSRLFDLSSLCGNRIDVNPHGLITIEPYISPAAKAASYRIDLSDMRGIALDDLSMSSNFFEIPNRAIVSYRYTEETEYDSVDREITAYFDSVGGNSIGSQGYVVAAYYEVSDLNPPTNDQALKIAKERLATASREKIEWTITVMYIPVWEGDTVELVIHDGPEAYQGVRHCLVKNAEIDFNNWTISLTLKETSSGDEE